jgi:hypothetical protein
MDEIQTVCFGDLTGNFCNRLRYIFKITLWQDVILQDNYIFARYSFALWSSVKRSEAFSC